MLSQPDPQVLSPPVLPHQSPGKFIGSSGFRVGIEAPSLYERKGEEGVTRQGLRGILYLWADSTRQKVGLNHGGSNR